MFPNGSPTGLASAKPFGPAVAAAATQVGLTILDKIMPGFGGNSGSESNGQIIYGAMTSQENASIYNKDIGNSVSLGSTLVQNGNTYTRRA